jgi:hypothetical protein
MLNIKGRLQKKAALDVSAAMAQIDWTNALANRPLEFPFTLKIRIVLRCASDYFSDVIETSRNQRCAGFYHMIMQHKGRYVT